MHALVVEANPLFQKILGQLFRAKGFEVEITDKGQDALSLIEGHQFDLICIAFYLKDMKGVELARSLRTSREDFYTPIVMVTAEEGSETARSGMLSGVTEVFHKSALDRLQVYLSTFVANNTLLHALSGHVLLVEDSLSMARLSRSVLESIGLQVTHCTTGLAALQAMSEGEYDLVLTDVVLEGEMSGLALVRQVRALPGSRGATPVLAISGHADVTRRIELLKSGANDFVSKPFVPEELLARAINLVRGKQLLAQVEAQRLELETMALTDQLTGLRNRHFVKGMAPKMFSAAIRHKHPLSIIALDIDHFKQINDTHGHAGGDDVLAAVGAMLNETFRTEDVPARIGGEEFIILLSHCSLEHALAKAEQLRQQISVLRPSGIAVTSSFGVATLTPDAVSVGYEQLLSKADEALYRAKEGGRNRVEAA